MAKPMSKPVKKSRRFAEGDLVKGTTNVRTRSDDEIGDTNPRTGVYTPGSYKARQDAGEANLNAVKGFLGRLTGGSKDSSESSSTASTSKPSGGLRGNFSSASSGASGDDTGKPSGSPLKGVSTKQSNTESAAESAAEPKSTSSDSTSSSEYKPTINLSKPLHTSNYDYEAPKAKKKFAADKPVVDKKPVGEKKPAADKKPVKDTSNYSNEGRSSPAPAKKAAPVKESKSEKKGIGPYNAFGGVGDYMRRTFTAEGRDEVRKENKKKSGGAVKMASGGMTASRRGDGIAQRGKTRGKMC